MSSIRLDRIDTDRFTGTGGTGDEQMGHGCQAGGERFASHVFPGANFNGDGLDNIAGFRLLPAKIPATISCWAPDTDVTLAGDGACMRMREAFSAMARSSARRVCFYPHFGAASARFDVIRFNAEHCDGRATTDLNHVGWSRKERSLFDHSVRSSSDSVSTVGFNGSSSSAATGICHSGSLVSSGLSVSFEASVIG